MKFMGFRFLVAAYAALAMQANQANKSAPLEPSAHWSVNYSDTLCLLSRQFGTGEHQIILGFRPGPMSDSFRIGIVMADKSPKMTWGTAKISLDGDASWEAPFAKAPVQLEGMHLISVDTDRSKIGALESAKSLQISGDGFDFNFRLSGAGAAMKALSKCEKDVLVHWGMDADVVASIKTFPYIRSGLVTVFRNDDYPMAAMVRNEQGTVGVRFWVSKEGKVTDCRIVESSRSVLLDRQSCQILEHRAHFEPARTATGEAVATIAFQRIQWALPR